MHVIVIRTMMRMEVELLIKMASSLYRLEERRPVRVGGVAKETALTSR
jgi:hypothetical protein